MDGHPRCPLATPESMRNGLQFVAQKGDLLQSSYPRSGTHWVQYIIHLIVHEGKPLENYEAFLQSRGFIEYCTETAQNNAGSTLRMFMTHLPLRSEKLNPEAKYVYVARNPWDVCVSLYHLMKSLSVYRFEDGAFDDFLDAFFAGSLPYGCYFEHLMAGYSLRGEPNVFFLTYEELQKNTREVVVRLARFIGEPYSNAINEDSTKGRKLLDSIMRTSSADSMRKIMVMNLSVHPYPEVEKQLKSIRASTKASHEGDAKQHEVVRNATGGEWKKYFSPDQLRRMEAAIQEKMSSSRVMDLWSDIRAEALRLCRENGTPADFST